MSADSAHKEDGQSWESVHVCPNCGHAINLAELDLRAITTGIVTLFPAAIPVRSKYKLLTKCHGRGRLRSSNGIRRKWEVAVVGLRHTIWMLLISSALHLRRALRE